jgi:hypothetical protein
MRLQVYRDSVQMQSLFGCYTDVVRLSFFCEPLVFEKKVDGMSDNLGMCADECHEVTTVLKYSTVAWMLS